MTAIFVISSSATQKDTGTLTAKDSGVSSGTP